MLRKIIPDVIDNRPFISVGEKETVLATSQLMRKHDVGAVLVIEDDVLKGIITVNDMAYRIIAEGKDPKETLVAEVMTSNPDTIRSDSLAIDALRLMQDGNYRHLPVVDDEGVLGIVSRRDFFGDEKARLDEETSLWEHIA